MSTQAYYTKALEQRLEWLRWAQKEGREMYSQREGSDAATARSIRTYQFSLSEGPTYYMNDTFCSLVDYARQSVPDDLKFEQEWMVTPSGWMWLQTPFQTPRLSIPPQDHEYVLDSDGHRVKHELDLYVSAISWFSVNHSLAQSYNHMIRRSTDQEKLPSDVESTFVFTYLDRRYIDPRLHGFGMWSYFVMIPGETVINRIHKFEKFAATMTEGGYVHERASDMLHEVRWVYTAMHLMSQKLTTRVEHQAERGTRRRWAKENVPLAPLLQVVTLRRMEEARPKPGIPKEIDWQWQWHVKGFWRNQWYPTLQMYKPKWVEDYIKGPPDRPLKPPTTVIYKAAR